MNTNTFLGYRASQAQKTDAMAQPKDKEYKSK